jgi:peptidoglycan/xylan/chitin deacetylase (PgdA/CDA1 family)
METLGHTIGAHGHCHEPFSQLSQAQCREDMHQIAAILRAGLGPDIRPFSYPYGQFNNDTCAACRDAGFVHAFTTERRWLTRESDLLRLPRVDTIHVAATLKEEVACSRA